jgi:hypothetical protein
MLDFIVAGAELNVHSRAPQVILGDGAQHRGFVGAADEDLGDELTRMNGLLGGEAMLARHQCLLKLPKGG